MKKGTKPDEKAERTLWKSYRFHPGGLERPPGDFSYDLILSDYHYARGRFELAFSREKEALAALRKAEAYGYGIKEILNNLGGTLAEAGKQELAIPFLKSALEVQPDYDLALRNLANVHFTLKRYVEGLPVFERALASDPHNPVALLGKARAHKARKERASAYLAYMKVFERYGENAALRKEIEEFIEGTFGKATLLAVLPEKKESNLEALRKLGKDPFEDFAEPNPLKAQEHLPWAKGLPADPMSAGPNPPAPLPTSPAF